MPQLNEANVRHLLRRTEIVDRPDRVAHLLRLGSIEAAVDDVMNISANPPSASLSGAGSTWEKGQKIIQHWLGQMAETSRPFGERMAFFWHGHLCSELSKVNSGEPMREQIDLFRRTGLGPASKSGNVSTLVRTTSTQVAMLRYLDNVENRASSPNQNFARELMELFLLGVGNYTEADVEAATAAWTGHTTPRWDVDEHVFKAQDHEPRQQRFLGKTINAGLASNAGYETIEVILGTGPLGTGIVPTGKNGGAKTRDVAAAFLTRKLWQEFGEAASGSVPARVDAAMRAALVDSGFAIRPWVRAMLVHDDFYAASTKGGLVRQPVEYMVALMVATGLDAEEAGQLWLMDRAGQQMLYPPNVSGWKPNGYWVNASTMGARQRIAQGFLWSLGRETWQGDDRHYQLPGGELTDKWIRETKSMPAIVDHVLAITGLTASTSSSTRQQMIDHLSHRDVKEWHRTDALLLALTAPDMHIA